MSQEPEEITLQVEGVKRSTLVYPGSASLRKPSPVVLVFHGFNGNAGHAARKYSLHSAWEEAIAVYPQGLTVYSPRWLSNRPGWQHRPGEYDVSPTCL